MVNIVNARNFSDKINKSPIANRDEFIFYNELLFTVCPEGILRVLHQTLRKTLSFPQYFVNIILYL